MIKGRKFSYLAVLLVAGALAVGGCISDHSKKFSHKLHSGNAKCVDCHKDQKAAEAATCAGCHKEKNYMAQSARPANYSDVKFDHSPHASQDCAVCHADADKARCPQTSLRPEMTKCMTCHDGDEAPAECSTCHTTIRADKSGHPTNWKAMHGKSSVGENSCNYCHGKNSCDECHEGEKPKSHTPSWKNSGHGKAADFDWTSCNTCHKADYCSECHVVKPSTHYGANFKLPSNANQGHAALVKKRGGTRSCTVCHTNDLCSNCH